MRAQALRAVELSAFSLLAAWTAAELVAARNLGLLAFVVPVWLAGIAGPTLSRRGERQDWERGSRTMIGVVFFANRIGVLGSDLLPMSAFLALFVSIAIVERFDRIFGEAYRTLGDDEAVLREMDRALVLGLSRALGVVGLSLAVTLVAANAIALSPLPFTSSITALVLALLFIAVVARMVRPAPSPE